MLHHGRQVGINGRLRSLMGTASLDIRGSGLRYDSSSRRCRGFPAAPTRTAARAAIRVSAKVGFPPRNSATAAAKQLYISASTVRRLHQWNSRETGPWAWALCGGQDGFNEAADDDWTSDYEVGKVTPHSQHDRWRVRYEDLVEFKKEHGHCRVPCVYKKNPQLGAWVHNQRQVNRKGKLAPERKRRLDDLGFVWRFKSYDDERWEKMIRQLNEFKEEHGHCRVPYRYKKNPELERWASMQREANRKGKLAPERKRQLEELGFVWSRSCDEKWDEMFRQLKEFKKEHGHCRVPYRYKKNPKLGTWVHNQRQVNRKGKLAPERKLRLDYLGFIWRFKSYDDERWEEMFRQLNEFQMEHGHCSVPKKHPKLRIWVQNQWRAKAEEKLTPERERRMEGLGIFWSKPRDGNFTE